MRTAIPVLLLIAALGCRRPAVAEKSTEDGVGDKSVPLAKKSPYTEPPVLPISGWTPDVKLLDQLDPPTEAFGYLIRPPKGYKEVAHKAKSAAVEMIWWESPARADFKHSYLMLSAVVPANPNDPKFAPEQVLADSLAAAKRFAEKWSQSGIERGEINGVSFVRGRFRAYFPLKQQSYYMRGIFCVARDGNRVIQLGVREETTREGDEFLDLAKTGMLTFKKK